MSDIQLGQKARDVITRFEGTVVGRVVYLTGCDQVLLSPGIGPDGAHRDAHWFDVDRIEILDATPIVLPRTSNGADRPAPIK